MLDPEGRSSSPTPSFYRWGNYGSVFKCWLKLTPPHLPQNFSFSRSGRDWGFAGLTSKLWLTTSSPKATVISLLSSRIPPHHFLFKFYVPFEVSPLYFKNQIISKFPSKSYIDHSLDTLKLYIFSHVSNTNCYHSLRIYFVVEILCVLSHIIPITSLWGILFSIL